MGGHAAEIQTRLREDLAGRCPTYAWETESRVGETPVDLLGTTTGRVVAVEIEWRRADPADNTAKLLRHLAEGSVGASRIAVVQVFTAFYDRAAGGVSSKRANAEFVGDIGAKALDGFEYHPIDLRIDPPAGEAPLDDGWRGELAEAAAAIARVV